MAGRQADLHTHSNRSDGLLSPTALVERAKQVDLACIALTDHDSVAGVAEALEAGANVGLRVIAGAELSIRETDEAGVKWDDHMLGLYLDWQHPELTAYFELLQQGRVESARETIAILATLGFPVSAERVAELAAGATITRPHIARALVEAGHVASEREAFDQLLGSGKPASPERATPSSAVAIRTIRAAGGVAGLAHPVFPQEVGWEARLASLPARLDGLKETGLLAVECFYPDATAEISGRLEVITRERGLIAIGGSDYHGEGKAPYVEIGRRAVGPEVLVQLEAARPH